MKTCGEPPTGRAEGGPGSFAGSAIVAGSIDGFHQPAAVSRVGDHQPDRAVLPAG